MDYNTSISFASRSNYSSDEREKRKHKTQEIATGTAAGGTAAYQAKRMASKNYLRGMFQNVTNTARTIDQNAAEAMTLWQKFRLNSVKFAQDASKRLMKLQNNKILGPIVKSKAMKGITTGFGVVTAAFVLVTGVSDSIKTGKLAAGNLKDKLDVLAA